jgi:hypothetical protein
MHPPLAHNIVLGPFLISGRTNFTAGRCLQEATAAANSPLVLRCTPRDRLIHIQTNTHQRAGKLLIDLHRRYTSHGVLLVDTPSTHPTHEACDWLTLNTTVKT